MIYNFEMYKEEVELLLKKLPVMKTEQLEKYLTNYFEIDSDLTRNIILALQRSGTILLSSDGWALSKGMYLRLTGDRFREHRIYDEFYQLSNMESYCSKYKPEIVKCFWLIVDMLPLSHDFVITDRPYNIAFTTSPKEESEANLFQIVCLPKGIESVTSLLLESMPEYSDTNIRESIKRIALLEDKEAAWRVPYIGFSNICLLDDNSPNHYQIIEQRKLEDRWKVC